MIQETLNHIPLTFSTDTDVFSPKGVDTGTKALLSFVTLKPEDSVLDLGCGYGVVGIWAAKQIGSSHVTMVDISEKAIACARANATLNQVSEGLTILVCDGVPVERNETYSLILSNPPYHTDFSVPKRFIEQGYKKLVMGGSMYMVVKRRDWYKNKLASVFGSVRVYEKDGYFILIAQKREKKQPMVKEKNSLSKKLQRKYRKR